MNNHYGGSEVTPPPGGLVFSQHIQDQMNMIMPHIGNIQQMEQAQLDGLLMSLLQMVGPEIAGQLGNQMPGGMGPGRGGRGGGPYGFNQRGGPGGQFMPRGGNFGFNR
jgi:hypothetical protein